MSLEQGQISVSDSNTAAPFAPPPPSSPHPLTPFLADPEPAPVPVDGALLLDDLVAFITRHVLLPSWAADALALWCLHTYAFEKREISVYIGLESPEKRCGKTTLLNVLSRLVRRPVAAANLSSTAFFRAIEEIQPTLLIDEALDLVRQHSELRGILNAGYHRESAFVLRASVGRPPSRAAAPGQAQPASTLERFSCWCPKLICVTGRLPDALADRCILVRMQRKSASEHCERLSASRGPSEELRARCLRFAADHSQTLATASPALPPQLHDRAADIWEPLLSLADAAAGSWPDRARSAAVGLTLGSAESSPGSQLLLDCFVAFDQLDSDRLLSLDLMQRLVLFTGRPWLETLKGRPMTAAWLACQLRPYGIRPSVYREGDKVGRGYLREDFAAAIRRYVPDSEYDAILQIPEPPEPVALKNPLVLRALAGYLKSRPPSGNPGPSPVTESPLPADATTSNPISNQ